MSEKTLLVEIEKDQDKIIEEKIKTIKKVDHKEEKSKNENRKPLFSASTYSDAQEREKEEQQVNKIESKVAQVIEKPNYDYMETLSEKQRKKIFVVKKDKNVKIGKKTRKKALKYLVNSLIFRTFAM